jgi:hypothetical protein
MVTGGDEGEEVEFGPLATTVIEYVVPEDNPVKLIMVEDP